MSVRLRVAALPLAAVALLLSSCTTTQVSEAAPAATTTVTSDFGDVVMPSEPQAALGMYTTDVDILVALGFPLADDQPIRGDGYTDFPDFFPQDELADVTPFANYPDYNYEKIVEAQPDFILNGLGYDADTVERLPEIAPTYSVDAFDGRSWMEHFEETAVALGRVEQYEAWMERYRARIEEVKAAIGDEADGLVVAPVAYWEGSVNSSCYSGVECQAFEDLGLTVFEPAQADDGEGVALSGEQLGQLAEIDVAFTIQNVGDAGEAELDKTLTELAKNPLWADLAFVQDDRLHAYELEMTYGSPSGQMAFLDEVEKALTGG